MSTPTSRPVHLAELVRYVADRHGVTVKDILGPRRWSNLIPPRRAIAAALFECGWTYPAIARALHRKSHTSIMYYLGAIKSRARAA